MIYKRMVFRNSSPLSFKKTRATTDAASQDYIPGSSLYGAIAGSHLKCIQSEASFNQLLFDEDLIVGNLYPANFKMLTDSFNNELFQPLPLPASTFSCKRYQGFISQGKNLNEEYHGVYDLLKYWTLFALFGKSVVNILSSVAKCNYEQNGKTCNGDKTPIGGYFGFNQYGDIEKTAARLEVVTRTAVDRKTGTALKGALFSRESLPEGQLFSGRIAISDDKWQKFHRFIEETSQEGFLRVGNSRSAGYGELKLENITQLNDDPAKEIKNRVISFTESVKELAKENGQNLNFAYLIPITLHSDAILVEDKLLRYCSGLSEELWYQYISKYPAKLIYGSGSNHQMIGWNALYSVPRGKALLVNKGSVYVFGVSEEPDPDSKLWEDLYRIQMRGIGKRTREGFGQIKVADRFHLEVHGR